MIHIRLFTIILAYAMLACGQKEVPPTRDMDADVTTAPPPEDSVSIKIVSVANRTSRVDYPVCDTTYVYMKLVNNTTHSLLYGDRPDIYIKEKGQWEPIKLKDGVPIVLYTSVAYVLLPGATQWVLLRLDPKRYDYKTGRYLVKERLHDEVTHETTEVSAEFEIRPPSTPANQR